MSKVLHFYCKSHDKHDVTTHHPPQERFHQRKKGSPKPNSPGRSSPNNNETRREVQDQKQRQKKKTPVQRSKQLPTATATTTRDKNAASSRTGMVKSTAGGWGLGRKPADSVSFGASRRDDDDADTKDGDGDDNEGLPRDDSGASHSSSNDADNKLSPDQQWDKAMRLIQYLD